jgi:hypothetical protein
MLRDAADRMDTLFVESDEDNCPVVVNPGGQKASDNSSSPVSGQHYVEK